MDMLKVHPSTLIILLCLCQHIVSEMCTRDSPLGMISGKIENSQITASTSLPQEWDKLCHKNYSRPYGERGKAWCAKFQSASEWLQIDLGVPAQVTGLLLQGRADGRQFVTEFMFSHSMDGNSWEYVRDSYNNGRVFEGNKDSYEVKHIYLDKSIIGRYVRVHTSKYHTHPSMRVEILGCQVCMELISQPPYVKLSASSEPRHQRSKRMCCSVTEGHIIGQLAWSARRKRNREWIRVDLGPPSFVTGVVTKGRGDLKERQSWVTKYQISYSNDTKHWWYYRDILTLNVKTFQGNVDGNSPTTHFFQRPFRARYVRFNPRQWHTRISMRVGVLGCPHSGNCGEGFSRIMTESQCVENLAFGKDAWIQRPKHSKRDTGDEWNGSSGKLAVDGDTKPSEKTCTILTNTGGDTTTWTVDLGKSRSVSGVLISTAGHLKTEDQNKTIYFSESIKNLDRLSAFISDQKEEKEHSMYSPGGAVEGKSSFLCGFVTIFVGEPKQNRYHIPCSTTQKGRYISIKATGLDPWGSSFSIALCEVEVYE